MGREGCGADNTGLQKESPDQEDCLSLQTAWPRSQTQSALDVLREKIQSPRARAAPKSCLPGHEEKMSGESRAGPKRSKRGGKAKAAQASTGTEATETPVPGLLFNKVEVTEEQPASRSRAGSRAKTKTHAADEQELLAAPTWRMGRDVGPGHGQGREFKGKSGKKKIRDGKHLLLEPQRRQVHGGKAPWRRCHVARMGRGGAQLALKDKAPKKGRILSWRRLPAWREGPGSQNPIPPATPALTQAKSGHLSCLPLPLV